MAITGWGTAATDYLSRTPAPVGAYPFMLSIWGHRNSTTGNRMMMRIAQSAGDIRRGAVRVVTSGTELTVIVYSPYVEGGITTVPTNTWFHGSGCFVDTTTREVRLNGSAPTSPAGTSDPAAADEVRIGHDVQFGDNWGTTDGLAEASIWDITGFTQTDRSNLNTKLANGDNPVAINAEVGQVWTGMLVAYWPLLTHTDLNDYGPDNLDLSMVGTLSTFASHPTVDPIPSDKFIVVGDSLVIDDRQYQQV